MYNTYIIIEEKQGENWKKVQVSDLTGQPQLITTDKGPLLIKHHAACDVSVQGYVKANRALVIYVIFYFNLFVCFRLAILFMSKSM